MKRQASITHPFVFLAVASVMLAAPGCGKQPATAENAGLSIDEKIKSVEKSDFPPAVKQKTIEKLRAQQGQNAQTK